MSNMGKFDCSGNHASGGTERARPYQKVVLEVPLYLQRSLDAASSQRAPRSDRPQSCFNKDGHLLTFDTRKLRRPYLRKIVERGKKFRLDSDRDTVFSELRQLPACWVTSSARGKEEYLAKLEDWAPWGPRNSQCPRNSRCLVFGLK